MFAAIGQQNRMIVTTGSMSATQVLIVSQLRTHTNAFADGGTLGTVLLVTVIGFLLPDFIPREHG